MKKLLAMLLALAMVFSLVACSNGDKKEEGGKDEGTEQGGSAAVTPGVVHKISVFQNTLGSLTAKEMVWAAGKTTNYNGYSLSEYMAANNMAAPSADTVCWLVAGTDKYASNFNFGDMGDLSVAIEDTVGKGRTPITCGESNNSANNPFNIELIVIGENAIVMLDVAGSSVGTLSGWISYMKDAEIAFDSADQYTFTLTDGSTKTVPAADIDTVDLKTVQYVVAG